MSDDATGPNDGDSSGVRNASAESNATLNATFDLLSSRRRRYALYHLDAASVDVFDLDELVDAVVEWERATDSGDDDGDDAAHRRRVAVSLHHEHLPKLADAGVVDYDARSRTVRFRDADDLAAYLALSVTNDRS